MAGGLALADQDVTGGKGHMLGHGVETAQIDIIDAAANTERPCAAGVAGVAASPLGAVGRKGFEFQHGSLLAVASNLDGMPCNGNEPLDRDQGGRGVKPPNR